MKKVIKKFCKKIKYVIKKLFVGILEVPIFKIDNKKIVFDNFNGKGFGCNPKYIALELIKENIDCKMIWLVNDLNTEMPCEIKKVKYGSFRSYFELATAKIWIDNVRNYKGIEKKKEQFYLQTWHASIGLKKCEADIENLLSPNYVSEAKNDGQITDLMISDSKFVTNVFKSAFWYDGPIKEIGFPRNDILNNCSYEIKKKIYDFYKIDYFKKIAIYAPTFRKNVNLEYFSFDFERCCHILKKKFNEDFVLFIRLHPNDVEHSKQIIENENIINVTLYPDVQELLSVSSLGITDYSSVAFDLAVGGKPVFLLCKDYDNFISKERDLFFDMYELPFKLNLTEDELYDNIIEFSQEEYKNRCSEFFKREDISPIKTSTAAYDVVQIIKEKIKR